MTGQKLTPEGNAALADEYLTASEVLYKHPKQTRLFYVGPLLHSIGLASELVFKAALGFAGKPEKEIRKIGHNLSQLYECATETIDDTEFISRVWEATKDREIPLEVMRKMKQRGE